MVRTRYADGTDVCGDGIRYPPAGRYPVVKRKRQRPPGEDAAVSGFISGGPDCQFFRLWIGAGMRPPRAMNFAGE